MSEYIVSLGNKKKNVIVVDESTLSVDGRLLNYQMTKIDNNNYILKLDDSVSYLSADKKNGDTFKVYVGGKEIEAVVRSALQQKAIDLLEKSSAGKKHNTEVRAPMPGMILKIKKNTGDIVNRGESIIILEAMKMENDLHSPASGVIKTINVKEGSAVEKGTVLFSIE